MTLEGLLQKIMELGISNRCVNYAAAGSSIYEINAETVRNYPMLFVSPTGNHTSTEQTMTYSITMYYIDRLLNDSSNDISIFSYSIENLKNIIRGIEEMEDVIGVSDSIVFTNFTETERLSDRCAGAFATVDIMVVNGGCYQE